MTSSFVTGLTIPELYKTLDFIHDPISSSSQVVVWMHPIKLPSGSEIPKTQIVKLEIVWTEKDPCELYRSPSSSHIMTVEGLGLMDSHRIYLPPNTRRCYQCEYDEFIYDTSLTPEYDHDPRDIINNSVWTEVQKYLSRNKN